MNSIIYFTIIFSFFLIGCSTTFNEAQSSILNTTEDDYKILRIVDGDTVIVEYNNKPEYVRIIGIDAPEKEECFSKESTERLNGLIGGKTVILEPKPNENRDKYNRLLRYVVFNNRDIGAKLILEGFARNYPWFPHPKRKEYERFEQEARKNNLGLWRECN